MGFHRPERPITGSVDIMRCLSPHTLILTELNTTGPHLQPFLWAHSPHVPDTGGRGDGAHPDGGGLTSPTVTQVNSHLCLRAFVPAGGLECWSVNPPRRTNGELEERVPAPLSRVGQR